MSSPTDPALAQALPPCRGKLKVFLGYAAGVGKTCRMLEEAHQLQRQGVDVEVGYFESHGRKDTLAKSVGLPMIPRRIIPYRGTTFEEMDTPAILARHPTVCLVDELAHCNVPGSERSKRWEDVQVLLDAGINVWTTVNIQHLESLNDKVFLISGVRVRETVPDWFVKQADEVVMVDATSGALLNRLKRGDIYAPEKTKQAMENFFKESTLGALREMALRHTAHELESREEGVSRSSDASASEVGAPPAVRAAAHDRILIYLPGDASAAMLLRRGRRMADYLNADIFAVSVSPRGGKSKAAAQDGDLLEKQLNFARNLRIETRRLEGSDPAETLVDFAHTNEITQIVLARPRYTWRNYLFGSDLVLRVVQEAKDIRVIVVSERAQKGVTS